MKFQRILVPLDFSKTSEQALPVARQMAGPETEIHLLHVNQPMMVYARAGGTVPPASPQSGPTTEQRLSKLQDVSTRLDIPPGKVINEVIEGVATAPNIVDYAKEHDIDLIVMTTHGTTGVMRLLMGSVAEHVVRKAECPVLTLKAKA